MSSTSNENIEWKPLHSAAVLSKKKPWSRSIINDIYYLINCITHRPAPASLDPITRAMYLCQPSISNVHFLSWPHYIYYNKFIISFVCFVLTLKHWSDVSMLYAVLSIPIMRKHNKRNFFWSIVLALIQNSTFELTNILFFGRGSFLPVVARVLKGFYVPIKLE